MNNVILIGLPGAGKSTLGVILAKTLGMHFIDTDIIIQDKTGRLLQEIINTDGVERFLEIEEECILSLNKCHAVISTGGSVVLRSRAMKHLTSDGMIIYLEISYDEMVKRLKNITTRGIVLEPGQSLRDMYDQRIPLYERYADIRINCSGEAFESVVENVVLKIREHTAVLAEHS
ncbi:shikimate kinase [Methanospirillum hungatei JF-1]|jgi:shikimate kinase|uniref:Shikimate kinase n=1 Tax=Methanospirillum hungatei JF-1 (strain ATCC 27890 / DSM 864 / NBRC 100397 / JF-1) TaxID=323259 RepID=Q2FQ63_METHJ|nr:shikimate kinase [Methanospirillum hungatei]ABD41567.1 shikimate kinase [Methanospirillum hungatei JF-1]MBP9008009.1 shikimate kinase [Methanospirillum sp.]OQA54706.1 MAG: shikimate kinase [Euryarchaeota archaeon ADurb.Bin294]HOW05893.1 shikimate kinase [Methanospirillum hungatei]